MNSTLLNRGRYAPVVITAIIAGFILTACTGAAIKKGALLKDYPEGFKKELSITSESVYLVDESMWRGTVEAIAVNNMSAQNQAGFRKSFAYEDNRYILYILGTTQPLEQNNAWGFDAYVASREELKAPQQLNGLFESVFDFSFPAGSIKGVNVNSYYYLVKLKKPLNKIAPGKMLAFLAQNTRKNVHVIYKVSP